MFKSRHTLLSEAIADWQARGLLADQAAQSLKEDISVTKSGFGFAQFVILAGVLCLILAALSFVAANWDDFPRLLRVGLIIALLWTGWAGGAWAKLRGHPWLSEALYLLGCGMFGAGIMLISQMYHIQGDAVDAVWLWALGTTLGAALVRAAMPLIGAIVLWGIWYLMSFNLFGRNIWEISTELTYALALLVCAGLAWWVRSRLAAHLLTLSFLVWVPFTIGTGADDEELILPISTALYVVVVTLALWLPRWPHILRGFEAALLFYALTAVFATAMFAFLIEVSGDGLGEYGYFYPIVIAPVLLMAWQARRTDWPHSYDMFVCAAFAVIAAIVYLPFNIGILGAAWVLGLTIWITRMGWRLDLRRLRVLGMASFVISMVTIYGMTVGTLLGTSGFFLGAALVLLGSAYAATKFSARQEAAT